MRDGIEMRCIAELCGGLAQTGYAEGTALIRKALPGQSGALREQAWATKRKDLMGNAVMSLATGNARGSKGLWMAWIRGGLRCAVRAMLCKGLHRL